ncbi:hypothetical protein BJ912DRAFT_1147899 [Pholiota molesta]|nr:hypothetical protein BJ912DRAFT_1147899 [Pholiota molesta]
MLSNLIIAACVLISAIQPVISEPISLPGTGLNFLFRRQATSSGIDTSGIPTQCTTQCQAVVAAMGPNTTCDSDPVACLCTNALATSYQACLTCAVTNDPTDVPQTLADADIAALIDACNTVGTPVTVGGSSSSSSSNGAAATQTGGATTGGTTTAAAAAGTTPAPAASSGSSTGTTSAPTTSTTSGALHLRTSVVGAVFAALLVGTSFVFAV